MARSPDRLFLAFALLTAAACRAPEDTSDSLVRRPGEIEFAATVHAAAFDRAWFMPGYHALVWKGGRMAHSALLRTGVSDRDLIAALEAAGARPGDNLPMAAWEERQDSKNPAPDTVIAGSPVEVLMRLPGSANLVPLAEVLEDPAGRGLELRFGGNAANIEEWKSGCLVCLYSCPGSKVGNARYTVRDYVKGVTRFRVKPGAFPEDGTRVGVVLRLSKSS
jgi:hypothetical protein